MVRPNQLPFAWPASGALEIPTALLWMLTFQDNHGHLLGEHGPSMHTVLCTHLGRLGWVAGTDEHAEQQCFSA